MTAQWGGDGRTWLCRFSSHGGDCRVLHEVLHIPSHGGDCRILHEVLPLPPHGGDCRVAHGDPGTNSTVVPATPSSRPGLELPVSLTSHCAARHNLCTSSSRVPATSTVV